MKKFVALAGTGLLLMSSAAIAQDIPGPADIGPAGPEAGLPGDVGPGPDAGLPEPGPAETMPADPAAPVDAAPMAGDQSFSDTEIASFASAALQIQNLQGDAATMQEEAASIVAQSGIDAATFNAIGQAMQTDPEVAERVQLAAAELSGQPPG